MPNTKHLRLMLVVGIAVVLIPPSVALLADGAPPPTPLDQHWTNYLVWLALFTLAGAYVKGTFARLSNIEAALKQLATVAELRGLESKLERALTDNQTAQEKRLKQYFSLSARLSRVEERCALHGLTPARREGDVKEEEEF